MSNRALDRGSMLLSSIFALVAFGVGLWVFLGAMTFAQLQITQVMQHSESETLVVELLEYFRSMSPNQLLQYMAKNPVTGSTVPNQLYPFCAHVNILDRAAKKIENKDPLADAGTTSLLALDNSFDAMPNRYYQVQVVNMETLAIVPTYCVLTAWNPATGTVRKFALPPIPPALPTSDFAPNERLMITVGMTWLPRKLASSELKLKEAKRIALSTILPGVN